MKKLLLFLLLVPVAAGVFIRNWPQTSPVAAPQGISAEKADSARDFVDELLYWARRDDRRNFAAACSGGAAAEPAVGCREMRRLKIDRRIPWQVYSLKDNICRVVLVTADDEAVECVLQYNPDREKNWSFLALEPY